MKILILIDAWLPFVGGAQIQIQNLKRILEENYDCKYYILHSPSANILIRFLWFFWVIPQAIFLNLKNNFDIIHAHAYWPGIPAKVLSFLLRIPVVFTVHGSNLLDLKAKSPRALLEKFILTRIKYDRVISVASNFLNYQNVNKEIKVIPNGVAIEEFDQIKVKKPKDFQILFVGREDPVKGLKYLKEAFKIVEKEFPQTKLKIISQGWDRIELIKEYKKSHLFVLPSLSEGQPLTLLEAWASKLPVVVTKVGDNPLMVKNGVNGFLVEPKNVQSLADKIIKVLKDNKRELMGEKGYCLVKQKYSWPKCAQKVYNLYKRLISKRT